ncbi:MAG: TonB-dependent receptor [candidate division Zixibacteria bacterium]|nr:TonB-dependent receptor [candidate division Zixibacteria bacterium]
MKNLIKLAISVVLLVVFTYPFCLAGITGKLTGIVKDKQSGEALPGVSIRVVGTNIGAATGPDGRYTIINVPAGKQSVEAVVIGYTSIRKEEILVVPDLTTEVNFDLTVSAVELGKVTTVVAERPLIEKDVTGSTKIITSDEIKQMPVRGFQAVAQLQAGVVAGDNRQGTAIQIRGGRPGEVNYFIDGFNTQDIVTGGIGAGLNNNAIAEVVVLTGGFNAEYGQAMSGVVNTVTKESAIKTTGQLELRTDEFMGSTNGFAYNNADFSLAGPLIGKKLKYFASFEYSHRNDWNPSSGWEGRKPENWLKGYSGFGKLNYDLTPSMKLKAGGSYFNEKRKEFQILWRYNLNHLSRQERNNQMYYLTLTHNISKNTFYDLSVNYFVTKVERGDDSLWSDFNDYINTVSWTDSLYGPDGRYDYRTSGWSYGDNKRQDGSNIYYLPGVSQRVYSKRQSLYTGVNFNIVSQVNPYHQVKGGFEARFYTVRWFRIDLPWRANPFLDNYDKDYNIHGTISHGKPYKPVTGAFYIQDKMEFQGMVVNAGLRFDMLKAGAERFIDQLDVNKGTENTPLDYKVSPRLGIAFPVSENTLFHFTYGHFFQPPQLQYLYEGVADAINYINTGNAIIGDPGLGSEKTIAYEAGLTRTFSPTLRFDVTLFSKNMTNLVDTRLRTGLNRYVIYTNSDYARVRGVEFALEKRKERFISGKISYTLSEAKGTGSYQREGYYDYITSATGLNIVFPKTEFYLDFDQRHTISADIDIRAGEKEGVQPFRNAGLNILFTVGSGFPYTPRTPVAFNLQGLGKALGEVNSARQPWTYRLDLKADKAFRMGMFNSTFYLEVINLTDNENVRAVYESSGKPNTDGVIELLGVTSEPYVSRYRSAVKDPDNYDVPRMVRAGLVLGF